MSQQSDSSPKIFGIGLSRTGTTSLDTLLKALGYESHHFVPELFGDPDWSKVDQSDALMDSPIPLLYKDCDERYPGSKFILTTRDQDKWLTSMEWMLTHGKVIWNWSSELQGYHRQLYGTSKYRKDILAAMFDRYHQEVNEYFADRPDDLFRIDLDSEVGFDTKSLCEWLGKEPIDAPAPKVNARRDAPLMKRFRYAVKEQFGLLHHGV